MFSHGRSSSEMYRFITVFIVIYFMLASVISVSITTDNYIYAIEQLHTYNNKLFNSNPAIMSNEYSPRLLMNHIISFLMRNFRFAWEDVVVLFVFINILPYAFGVTNIVFRLFSRNRLIYATLLMLFILHGVTSGLGMYGMYGVSTIGSAVGISFVAISYIVGDNPRWNLAWIVLIMSPFVHIHDGIWGGG